MTARRIQQLAATLCLYKATFAFALSPALPEAIVCVYAANFVGTVTAVASQACNLENPVRQCYPEDRVLLSVKVDRVVRGLPMPEEATTPAIEPGNIIGLTTFVYSSRMNKYPPFLSAGGLVTHEKLANVLLGKEFVFVANGPVAGEVAYTGVALPASSLDWTTQSRARCPQPPR